MEFVNTFLFYLRRFKDLKKRQVRRVCVLLGIRPTASTIYRVLTLESHRFTTERAIATNRLFCKLSI